MTALLLNPFPMFYDQLGQPLDQGYIYVGEANKDPRQFPINVYLDVAKTNLAIQPLRTTNGIISNGYKPIPVFTDLENYSVLVLDKYGKQVFYDKSSVTSNFGVTDALDYIQQVTNNAELTAQQKFDAIDAIIAESEGIADQVAASQQARIDAMVNTGLVGAGSTDLLVALSDGSGLNQAQFNDTVKKSYIDYDKVVTVGTTGADFTTLNAALTEMSKYKQVYLSSSQFSNFKAKILIKSGYVVAEQINIIGIDFSWLDIASEDAEVTVSRAALTQKVGRWYSFIRCKSGSIPSIKCLFTMDNTGTQAERVGLYMIRANGFIEAGAGFKNAGERNVDLTQTSCLCASGGIFTGAKALSIRPATGSVIFLQYADLSNSANGLSVGSGATVAGEEMIANNCTSTAIEVQGGCTVDISNASLQNAGEFGLYASRNCVVNAASANFSGSSGYGIYADCGSSIDAKSATVNNCTGNAGIRVTNGARVTGNGLTATGNKINLQALKGGQIITDVATLTGAVTIGLAASEGGTIIATNSQYRRTDGSDAATDAQVLSGSTMYLNGSTGGASQKTDVQLPNGIIYKGVKTKNKGGAQIAAGQTSVTVSHTLPESPIVLVTPITSLGTATKWWVSNVDATSFKINIDATTSGAVTFHWFAELI